MSIDPNRLKRIYVTRGKIRADVSYVMWDLCSKCNGTSMPIPEEDELREDFLERCMGNRKMRIQHPDKQDRMIASKFLWTTRADICKLSERCQYMKKGYCTVESQYLNAITKPVLKLLKADCGVHLTEVEWLDFGLKMIPLYHDLIRVKKEEAALNSILIDSIHGAKVHPLLKEKRAIIKAIDSLDITKLLRDKFKALGIKDVTPPDDDDIAAELLLEREGDPDFADSLMENK